MSTKFIGILEIAENPPELGFNIGGDGLTVSERPPLIAL